MPSGATGEWTWLEGASAIAPALVGALWFALAVSVLICLRKSLARVVTALATRIEAGAPLRAAGVELGSAPIERDTTLPEEQKRAAERRLAPAPPDAGVHRADADQQAGLLSRYLERRMVLVVGASPYSQRRTAQSIATDDALGMAQIQAAVAAGGGGETSVAVVVDSQSALRAVKSSNYVVAVGGPSSNPGSDYLLPALGGAIHFDGFAIRSPRGLWNWSGGRTGDGLLSDYVLVVAGPHPLHGDGWCMVVAACHGAGTLPAVNHLLTLTEEALFPDAPREVSFELLLAVALRARGAPDVHVVEKRFIAAQ